MAMFGWLLNPSGLTEHGFCLSWEPGLIALHAGSDLVIGLAYLAIPLALFSLIIHRRDLTFSWIIYLFVAFILACSLTHFAAVLTLWVPAYGIEGLLKLVTAVISVVTAILLWPRLPALVALPSPARLEALNSALSARISIQEHTEEVLRATALAERAANYELERRVAEQTAQLQAANAQLTEALAQRLSAMRALAISEEAFRASFEAAVLGTVQVEPASGRILRANFAFASMLGYQPPELAGRLLSDFIWPDDRAADAATYCQFLDGKLLVYVVEKRYRRRNNEPIWGRMSGTMVRTPESGEPGLLVAVIEDIDQRHKAQIALQVAKNELEDVVQDRTVALQQRDLLLREVYHRVKNNLQIVDSLLVMQARQLADPRTKDMLVSLRARIQALGLVHQQLMGSTNLKTFNVAPFLQELSNNILDSGARDSTRLSVQAVPLDVNLDFAIPLGLVVTELVTNALKHAFPHGRGHIAVILEQDASGDVILVVSDDGQGPAQGHILSEPGKTGLGISIIIGLVAQLRGTFTMSHEHGTRAEVRIPETALA